MIPTPFAVCLAVAVLSARVASHPVKYDQRQEGELNVRTDVEDVVFVVVPPPDLIAAGMGLVAATAADFLRKNYGAVGLEKWPMRTSPKLGFVPVEKSPYKIDLEKSGFQLKKISHHGDPNRYNFHEGKNPTKAEIKPPSRNELDAAAKPTTEMMVEMLQPTTENKTVKKDLKQEEMKKDKTEEKITKKDTTEGTEEKKIMEKKPALQEEKKVLEKKKEEETKKKEPTEDRKVTEQQQQKKQDKPAEQQQQLKTDVKPSSLKVVTDDSNPDSILRLEGCGPDAYRDSEGKCIVEKPETAPK